MFTYDAQASWRIIVSIKVNPVKRENYVGANLPNGRTIGVSMSLDLRNKSLCL